MDDERFVPSFRQGLGAQAQSRHASPQLNAITIWASSLVSCKVRLMLLRTQLYAIYIRCILQAQLSQIRELHLCAGCSSSAGRELCCPSASNACAACKAGVLGTLQLSTDRSRDVDVRTIRSVKASAGLHQQRITRPVSAPLVHFRTSNHRAECYLKYLTAPCRRVDPN